MDSFLEAVQLFASDAFVFFAIQTALLVLVLYAFFAGIAKQSERRVPKKKRINALVLGYSVLSASIIQAVSSADLVTGFKLIVTIADLAGAFYLCFMNRWFRGVIINLVNYGRA